MKWHHNSYSEEVIADMQSEAERRVREMQARQRLLASSGADFSVPPPPPPPSRREVSPGRSSPQHSSPPPPPMNGGLPSLNLGRIIGELGIESDKLIIGALLWLLWSENADRRLLIALVYLLLK